MILREQFYQWRMWRLTDEQVEEAKQYNREHYKEMYLKHSGRDKIGEQALDRECIEGWFQEHIDELEDEVEDSETLDYEFHIEDDEGNDYGYDEEEDV